MQPRCGPVDHLPVFRLNIAVALEYAPTEMILSATMPAVFSAMDAGMLGPLDQTGVSDVVIVGAGVGLGIGVEALPHWQM